MALRIPIAYGLAYMTRSAEYPNGHPFSLSISLLVSWSLGMLFSVIAFRYGKTRKQIREEIAKQAAIEG